MSQSILVAGIGNIFQGDDAFGVTVVRRLAELPLPDGVRMMDAGIRSIDLAFELLKAYDFTILVDATARGGEPGTVYTIEIDCDDIPDAAGESAIVNAHGIDPVGVLSLAKSMGAEFKKLVLVGCEPLVTDCDDSGLIGLSEIVEAAVDVAVHRIRALIEEFRQEADSYFSEKEVTA